MNSRQLIFSLILSLLTSSLVFGEAKCPGDVAPLQYHLLGASKIAVDVRIDQSGPYEFLADTGAQITVMEPSLAAELHLQPEGAVSVVSGVARGAAELVRPERIEAGSVAVDRLLVAVESLARFQALYPQVRGILGENFLLNFDLLIDRGQRILCLDPSPAMQQGIRGERVPLLEPARREGALPVPPPLLISARLAEDGPKGMVLRVDSGASVPMIYVNHLGAGAWAQRNNPRLRRVAGNASEALTMLPAQDVRIGTHLLRDVAFVTPLETRKEVSFAGEDGLLPVMLFKRVFISYADRFVVFDPR
jgi:hypothetical protein